MTTKSSSRKAPAPKPATPLSPDRLGKLHEAAKAKGDGDLTAYVEAGEDGLAGG